jgi:hypothetical protein
MALVLDLDFARLKEMRERLPSLEHAREGRVESALGRAGLRIRR